MKKLQCAQIWGGIEEGDATIASPGLTATLFSSSGEGEKGGDIYYVSLCNSTYITRIAIADVVGHGEIVSEMSQSLYDSLGRHVDDLNGDEVLSDLNKDAITKGITAITTGIVATYYREDKTFSYVYAGHPPMLLNRNNDIEWTEMEIDIEQSSNMSNIPLAVDEDANYVQQSVTLNSGDRILLYTDGLLETISKTKEAFGMERLQTCLKINRDRVLDELRDDVINALRDHTEGKLEHDDVTMILLEIR
jgi:sigma-B regulation protein RsbU (phosphoserine phosphatase)